MAKKVDNKEVAYIWDIDKPLNESSIVLHKESTESEVTAVMEQKINPIVVIGEDKKMCIYPKKYF